MTANASYNDMTYSNPEEIGWRIEPGGRIHTWGFHVVETSGVQTVNFPVGFELAAFSVSVTNESSGCTDVHINSIDCNGFTFIASMEDIGSKINFEAFGR